MKRIYKFASLLVFGLALNSQNANAQVVSDFESFNLGPESYWNGDDLTGVNNTTDYTSIISSGDAAFLNVWDISWGLPGYWSQGFAVSSYTDSTTAGSSNLFSARPGIGNNNSLTYMVAQNNAIMEFQNGAADTSVAGIYVTNGTYAAKSMELGDSFAKKFGGVSGNDPDWFKLTIKGFDDMGNLLTDSVDFYLADYRDANNANDYIVNDWQFVDLTALGNVRGLYFTLSSSDNNAWGMLTPGFFCVDDIQSHGAALVDFEDLGITSADSAWDGSDLSGEQNDPNYVTMIADGDAEFVSSYTINWGGYWNAGFAVSNVTDSVTSGPGNLYSAKPAEGAIGSSNYVIGQDGSFVKLTGSAANTVLNGVYLSNSTYAYNSMRDGDSFAKKFGGATGDDPDWLKLTIRGYNNGVLNTDTIAFYLADFRDSDNSKDYILDTWNWVDLSSLGTVDSVTFSMSSTDNNSFGMVTPAFFALDNFNGVMSSIKDFSLATVNMYPNPAVDQVTISMEGKGNIEVYDLKGSLKIMKENVFANTVLNIESLQAGVYVVRIVQNGVVSTQRLVVE